LAQSAYSRQGWALEEAVPQTEALRRHFLKEYGKPKRTFITGHSMGGLITLATIEKYPDAYDGAMPMCGPLTPALFFFKDRVFDMLVTFDALFGDALPEEYRPLMEASVLPGAAVQQAFASDPEMTTKYALHYGMREKDVAGIVAMDHMLLRELMDRAGGNPFDNRETVYMGFDGLAGLNAMVKRYAADPAAVEYIRKNYTVTGDISDPVLAVHTTYDPGVPTCVPCYYDKLSALKDKEDLFVQMYVEAEGHCNFTPEQTAKALDILTEWVESGRVPEAGRIE
ncbi:MAG TPA: prolyl oligopeptidase family serine peptidase, partial [Candidatus Krumholzibacterium sp.]|nr:prolyl oligopeptidase family serine peptidase [Candidatus Krumholzibacterium sp.]